MRRMRGAGLTDYHASYFAHELSRRRATDDPDKLAGVVAGAQVDLNPHQVEAALFAFRSPLSKGALLADEVGLGKTIEAGLVISQRWAERRRRILVIVPANLRKQWHQELGEKFFLPCRILESRIYNDAIEQGILRPFESGEGVFICSYHFARSKASEVSAVPWDLVVLDEAHRLRNVYKSSNVIANTLRAALGAVPKLLLTATPLQNSLLELFGLVSFVDDHVFGDLSTFREEFARLDQDGVFTGLRSRLRPVCHRTLRRQVSAYVSYTRRLPILQEFVPEESEDRLYTLVSDYLQRENLRALPAGQRTLMTLVLRKLLASSTFAISGALETLCARLRREAGLEAPDKLRDELSADYEALDALAEEWPDESSQSPIPPEARAALEAEIGDLEAFAKLAASIRQNAKGKALLIALDTAFRKTRELGGAEKAVIFTESRRTQDYLLRVLADSPFAGRVVLFNGSNSDELSREIYASWLRRHEGSDRVTGSRTADMRSALVDYFREEGQIMIGTEAAAEGINLQFCSLVVNYDLPWNPQRIEQRIGRCHRYGQKHDVVVVNFVNRKNEADQRVYELLAQKFKLFEGVFGASDEVLGAIESGVDFEKRIADIYQHCRRHEGITAAFDRLQLELNLEINETMAQTKRKLLENFDEEVREKLRVRDQDSRASLGRYERLLMALTRHELAGHAEFVTDSSFRLTSSPFPGEFPLGLYELPRRSGEAHLYRLGHPLAEALLSRARERSPAPAEVEFDYTAHPGKISLLEPLVGQTGVLVFAVLTLGSRLDAEDHLLLAASTDGGEALDVEFGRRLMSLPGREVGPWNGAPNAALETELERLAVAARAERSARNGRFLEAEAEKLDGWADDLKAGLEREIKELDREIKESRTAAKAALLLEDKLAGQRRVKALESQRSEKRRTLFEAQDQIDRRREELLSEMEDRLGATESLRRVFTIRWRLT